MRSQDTLIPPDRACYPPHYRLLNGTQFGWVFKRNQRSQDHLFRVLARANALGHPRLGMAVARKACGNAVVRNRLKRAIRESFRTAQHGLPAVDLVVMVKPGVAMATGKELAHALAKHWQDITTQCAR